jgi:hypothetical protein
MWWELASTSGFVNGDQMQRLVPVESPTAVWRIQAEVGGATSVHLKGTYSSKADVQQAIRELTQGIDPVVVTEGTP